jgi:hypothetical protein
MAMIKRDASSLFFSSFPIIKMIDVPDTVHTHLFPSPISVWADGLLTPDITIHKSFFPFLSRRCR